MESCVRLKTSQVSKAVLTGLSLLLLASPAFSAVPRTDSEPSLPKHLKKVSTSSRKPRLSTAQRETRIKHARELFGKRYSKSIAATGEEIPKINGQIYRWTKEKLPKKFRPQYQKVAQTIIDESLKYEFDPVFLMSVIEGESSFRPDKIGGVGEIGLMQLRPSTAEWIAKREGLKWEGDKSLYDPSTNIRIGALYLSYLRDHFDSHARLYLAAYNMGQTNVANALGKNVWPKDYPIHVMKRYVQFYETMSETLAEKRKPATKVSES